MDMSILDMAVIALVVGIVAYVGGWYDGHRGAWR